MDVFNFKCKYCGGELNSVDGLKSVGKCKYCGSKQTLPKLENEKRANLFERANHLRRNNEFDKAEALYEQLLNEDLTDPEAYWSLVLCRYGIEYVEDKRSGERLPTVNRMQMVSILADEDYKSAIANADDEQKVLYEEEARLINEIQKGILEIARKEEPFDIFICYKETDADGKRSRDSILAQDLYHELTRDGYKVFFARVTLQGKLGSAYEPYIFSALNSSKVMVVLGTKKEHFEAVWVRNEWSRFLGQIKKGERKVLIPAYRDMDAYDLPVEFSNLQALDMSRLGFLQELVEGVENILNSYKKKEAPKAEPAPTNAPAPEPPKKKKKSKAPLVIIAIILALAIGGAAVFMSGVLDPLLNGGETEAPTGNPTYVPDGTEGSPEIPTELPTQEPNETEEESTSDEITETNTETGSEVNTEQDTGTETGTGDETESETDTDAVTELVIENPVTVFEEGVAYYGVLAHKNLGKLVYLNGLMDGEYYLGEVDEIGFAAKVYFEKAPTINHYMYFLEGSMKVYVNIIVDNGHFNFRLEDTPSTVWHYNETYKCPMANVNGDLIFIGTSDTGTYTNFCAKRITDGPTFFKLQFVKAGGSSEKPAESLAFEIDEATDAYAVTGIGTVSGENVVIPSTYNGKPVKFIAAHAFDKNIQMKSLYIPKNIVFIDEYAFNDCIYLSQLTYEGSYEEYMEINQSIYGNDSLRNEGIKVEYGAIESEIARDNYDFSFVWAPDGKSFYVAGIWNLENRTNMKIPEYHKGLFVTGINDYAFAAQGEMTSVYIPWSVTVIEEGAFAECTNLALVQFEGTEGDWNNIKINSDNNQLIKANIEYEVIREETCGHDGGETVDVSDGCKVKCSMCGEDLGTVSHSEITFVEEKAPTEEASGYSMYMCGVCKSTWKEEIPPLGDSGGSSSETVVSVSDATGLVYVIDQINSGGERNDVTIRLEADIDMSGVTFTPIKEFRGTIDGNGKTISNIKLPLKGASITITDGNYTSYSITAIGFIASAYDATVRNLILDNVTAEFNTDKTIFIGALVGYADGLTVENCTVNSTMDVTVGSNDTSGVSGLIGYSLDASAQNVRVNCDMVYVGYSTESFAGAMLGAGNIRIQSATIVLEISFTGSKYGHTGYLVGMERTPYGVTLTSMYNSTVSGTLTVDNSMGYCGGAIGQGEYSTIEQMTSSADNNTVNVRVDSNASN